MGSGRAKRLRQSMSTRSISIQRDAMPGRAASACPKMHEHWIKPRGHAQVSLHRLLLEQSLPYQSPKMVWLNLPTSRAVQAPQRLPVMFGSTVPQPLHRLIAFQKRQSWLYLFNAVEQQPWAFYDQAHCEQVVPHCNSHKWHHEVQGISHCRFRIEAFLKRVWRWKYVR